MNLYDANVQHAVFCLKWKVKKETVNERRSRAVDCRRPRAKNALVEGGC